MNAKFTPKLFLATLVASIIIPQLPVAAIATRREPPPEVFAACVGKSEGTAVSFTTRNVTLSATCRMYGGKLAATPDNYRSGAGGTARQMTSQPISAKTLQKILDGLRDRIAERRNAAGLAHSLILRQPGSDIVNFDV